MVSVFFFLSLFSPLLMSGEERTEPLGIFPLLPVVACSCEIKYNSLEIALAGVSGRGDTFAFKI